MSIRKIKVVTTSGISGTIETSVTTLGELKPLLRERNIDYSGMKLVVGSTRNELSINDAALPEGDFKLYLMPHKTKSGGNRVSLILNQIADLFDQLADAVEEGVPVASSLVKSLSAEDRADVEDLNRLAGNSTSYDEDDEDEDDSWL